MIRWLLGKLGYRLCYVCPLFGTFDHRYDAIDFLMVRPVHPDMSVAPPWARMKITRNPRPAGRRR